MQTTKLSAVVAALAITALFGLNDPATAKQANHVSFEQAFKICKKFVDMGILSWDQTAQRYARGGACMLKYGYHYGSVD
jgi:hypothetical protein